MSIIKKPAAPPKIAMLEAHLEEPLLTRLEAYCEFIDSTPDHVVATALSLVFKKDYEFKRWLKVKIASEKNSAEEKNKASSAKS
jgi:hypothetical protein